ncbi:MAG TPA: Hsp70 family protein [Flavobacterium sp.]|nr:Hsp70 family protein [Flavobacterium sp.]
MRTKIDYGIDLGTTNSAIARMENGNPVIKKSDTLKDTLPSCVSFNKKQDILVGDPAFNILKNDKVKALKGSSQSMSNSFIEFKRTMGTLSSYFSSNMNKEYTSEELSAEVLMKLKSFIVDENVQSIVITVPAKFTVVQKEATLRAGKLAGFKHIELLNEPVAASMAYGIDAKNKDGFWLVFDFGGGTFDAALLKLEEGVMTVKDTEGDNFLGGKNIDEAMVDQLIIPYLKSNYSIDAIIEDESKNEILRSAVKFYAEEAKIQMSFKDAHNILTDLGDLPFEDENGEEPCIDICINQSDMETVVAPIFQKAVDISKELLKRNHLKGNDLNALILVGGPTYSPVLRKMLKDQVTDNVDTSVDPMTAVAKGAALFASTLSVSEEVIESTRDNTKVQLDVQYNATSVSDVEYVTVKYLKEKAEGNIPDQIFVELVRGDKAWSSGKKMINDKTALIEAQLKNGASNAFEILAYDGQGNKLECQPNHINILQGITGGNTTLPYNIAIEIRDKIREKDVLHTVKGLERNKELPATGVATGCTTSETIRPGMINDKIVIPIYQGADNTDNTTSLYSTHVYDVIINGESFPALLPKGSEVEITIKIDRSEQMTFSAFFPLLNHTEDVPVEIQIKPAPERDWLINEISKAKKTGNSVKGNAPKSQLDKVLNNINELELQLEKDGGSEDGRIKILENLRKELRELDRLSAETEWPVLEKQLKDEFYELEDLIRKIRANNDDEDINMDKINAHIEDIRKKVDHAIREKNSIEAKELISDIGSLDFNLRNAVTGNALDAQYLREIDNGFNSINWKDRNKARQLINQGLKLASEGRTKEIRPVLVQIIEQMNDDEADKLGGKLVR